MATWRFRLASGVPLGTSVAVGGAMGAIPAAILQKEMILSDIRTITGILGPRWALSPLLEVQVVVTWCSC